MELLPPKEIYENFREEPWLAVGVLGVFLVFVGMVIAVGYGIFATATFIGGPLGVAIGVCQTGIALAIISHAADKIIG